MCAVTLSMLFGACLIMHFVNEDPYGSLEVSPQSRRFSSPPGDPLPPPPPIGNCTQMKVSRPGGGGWGVASMGGTQAQTLTPTPPLNLCPEGEGGSLMFGISNANEQTLDYECSYRCLSNRRNMFVPLSKKGLSMPERD